MLNELRNSRLMVGDTVRVVSNGKTRPRLNHDEFVIRKIHLNLNASRTLPEGYELINEDNHYMGMFVSEELHRVDKKGA